MNIFRHCRRLLLTLCIPFTWQVAAQTLAVPPAAQNQLPAGQLPAGQLPAGQLPAGEEQPFLRLEPGGPQSYVTALAFDRSGRTLYAAGWDKVVHVWRRNPQSGLFQLEPESTLRLPIGPGLLGAINALALSDDGQWLAVGGHGVFRGTASFRQPGRVVPTEGIVTDEMRRDEGLIYVFHTPDNTVRLLRGHVGSVLALAFVTGEGAGPRLVSAAREWRERPGAAPGYVGRVRVWDVGGAGGDAMAVRELAEPRTRPGLAAHRTGAGARDIQVGISWGDERFRVWDVATDQLQEVVCGKSANTVGLAPAGAGFLTAAMENLPSGTAEQLQLRQPATVAESLPLGRPKPRSFLYPMAMSVSQETAQQRDVALRAVALVSLLLDRDAPPQTPNKYLLQRFRVQRSQLVKRPGDVTLWNVPLTGALPAVAVAPDGELVAVAGDVDHSIWLFAGGGSAAASSSHGAPPANPFQILRNSGSRWQRIRFVVREGNTGLHLTRGAEQLVFDLSTQSVQASADGWQDGSATVGTWRIVPSGDPRSAVVTVQRGNQEVSRISLPAGEAFSTAVVLPGGDAGAGGNPVARRPTIIAIASHELGQVSLRLHNAETGERFRQLTGHSQTISSLSFDAGGRWLASVAGDQQICLWDLADWTGIVHQHGTLPGVAVAPRTAAGQEEIAVAAVDPTAPASVRGSLAAGDVLQRIAVGGDQRSWSTVREFYDAFWSLMPGTEVTLRVARQGRVRELPLRVGQGVDERKPLLSLFLSAADAPRPREWIAWSPLGPYETSGRDAERFLGWHFNTGDATRPTRFAAAEEYRGTYYREGLVKELLALGRIPPRLAPMPAATSLRFDPETQQQLGAGETVIIRKLPRRIHLFLGNFPSEYVGDIEVAIAGKKVADFEPLPENEWVADLEDPELRDRAWKRGATRIVSTVQTNEVPSRQFTREVQVRYLPLPPVVRRAPPASQIVDQPVWRFSAELESPSGEPLTVKLIQNGRPLEPVTVEPGPGPFARDLQLQPGDNTIELVAMNQAAVPSDSEDESVRTVYRVTYQKAKALPPQLAVQKLEAQDAKTGEWLPVWREGSELSTQVTSAKLRITGSITAAEPLSAVQWAHVTDRAAQPPRQQLTWQETGAKNVWQFSQEVELEPGPQQLIVFARSADSDEASFLVAVDYRPPLPELEWETEEDPGIVERDAGDPSAELVLAATLSAPQPAYPFEAEILLNDEPVGAPAFDADRSRLTAKVTLKGGENRVRVALKNRWGVESSSETRILYLRRLPRVVVASHSPVVKQPYIDVVATIETPLDRPLKQVTIAGKPLYSESWRKSSERDGVAIWEVTAQGVPLQPGNNAIAVEASNGDGACRKPFSLAVTYDAALWRPPAIVITNAAPTENVTQAQFALSLQVGSASPLRQVRILVNDAPVPVGKMTVAGPKSSPVQPRWDVVAELSLRPGVNRVVVTAQNDGGESREERAVNFVQPPVRIQVIAIEPEDDPRNALRPVVMENGRLACPQALPSGSARLRGVVEFNPAVASAAGAKPELRVWVNGFQQPPVALDPKRAKQEFITPIVLSGTKDNLVSLDIAGAPTDANNRLQLTLDCREPRTAQRLNLLIVGANPTDAPTIRRNALEAIRAEKDAQGNFVEPLRALGFHRVKVYPPLTKKVTFSDFFRLLLQVKADLKIPLGTDPSGKVIPVNDVVMLYYEGGILIPDKDHFVLRTSERFDPNNRFSAINSEWLAQFFDSMRGAQLAFIDVSTDKPPASIPTADWNHSTHAALLCYSWQRGFVPAEGERLIQAVDRALGTAHRLGEVDEQLQRLSAAKPEVDYTRVLPDRLKALILASPD